MREGTILLGGRGGDEKERGVLERKKRGRGNWRGAKGEGEERRRGKEKGGLSLGGGRTL